MSVLFLPEVVDQFLELTQILFDKGYLNSKDAAIEYSECYGTNLLYSSFKHSRHTTWYVLYSAYDIGDDTVFLVRHLTNNHVIAHRLGMDND